MRNKLFRSVIAGLFVTVFTFGSAVLMSCEPKRERIVHRETVQKDVVVDDGPVVE